MKDINELVTKEFTKIFDCLNKQYFNNELSTPLFILGNRFSISNGSVRDDTVVMAGQDGVYTMVINNAILNKDINEIAVIICHNMIRYYGMINNENMVKFTSSNGMYHNKNFKEMAGQCDLLCERSDLYGWNITLPSDKFNDFCKKNDFKKTWKGMYNSPEIKKSNSSTMKYACGCGRHKSVRVTRIPNIICGVCGERLVKVG